MKEKVPLGYRTNLDHWQVAQQFTVQNLTLPPLMPVAKVTEYVHCGAGNGFWPFNLVFHILQLAGQFL